jgi:uncharacterized protein
MQTQTSLKIDRPERWAKQLASHLGNRAALKHEGDMAILTFEFGGTGEIWTTEDAVHLRATAETPENMETAQNVLGKHLLRFSKLIDTVELDWRQV